MKKIFAFILIIFLSNLPIMANNQHTLNFGGNKYKLLYSTKNKEFGGYLNEYFKRAETYNTWTEMVSVHHFPNAYSPIDQIKQFRQYLGSLNCPSAISFDDKKNSAMIDFIMINSEHLPIVMEFDIFKYQKSQKCGSVALQYSKRYIITTEFQMEAAKADIEKNRKKYLKSVKKYKVPEIVLEEIDLCKFEIITKETNESDSPAPNSTTSQIKQEIPEETAGENNNKDFLDEDLKQETTTKIPEVKEWTADYKEENLSSEQSDFTKEDKQESAEIKKENLTESTDINDKKTLTENEIQTEQQKTEQKEIVEQKDTKKVEQKASIKAEEKVDKKIKQNTEQNIKTEKKVDKKIKQNSEQKITAEKKCNTKEKKQKNKKSETYQIINDKSDLYQTSEKIKSKKEKTYTIANDKSDLYKRSQNQEKIKTVHNKKKIEKEKKERVKKAKQRLEE